MDAYFFLDYLTPENLIPTNYLNYDIIQSGGKPCFSGSIKYCSDFLIKIIIFIVILILVGPLMAAVFFTILVFQNIKKKYKKQFLDH